MKRLICTFTAFVVVCSLAGCQKSGLPQPDFPLTEDAILSAQSQTGLPGIISDTFSSVEGHTAYTLYHPTKTYGRADSRVITAAISSALTDGGRFLSVELDSLTVTEKPEFKWEDWKQQFEFATLLYGGFADAEEVFRAFSAKDANGAKVRPKGNLSPGPETYKWAAQLPNAFCTVSYTLYNTSKLDYKSGAVVNSWRCRLNISFYESIELQRKILRRGSGGAG